jgi:hypothetical protein
LKDSKGKMAENKEEAKKLLKRLISSAGTIS